MHTSVSVQSGGQLSQAPVCGTCGKQHFGVCKFGSQGCYRCREIGYLKRDCPRNLRNQSSAPSGSSPSVQKEKRPVASSQGQRQPQREREIGRSPEPQLGCMQSELERRQTPQMS